MLNEEYSRIYVRHHSLETYPQHRIVVRAAQRDRGGRLARAATEVRIVAGRMDDPIVPADLGERNVQALAAARLHARRTVDVALRPARRPVRVRVDDNERPIVVVQAQQIERRMRLARRARDVDDVRQVLVLDPALHLAGNVDFHPQFCIQQSGNGV